MQDCIFCKIANGEIPKEFVYQDDDVLIFDDIAPLKPVHMLVIPRVHVTETMAVEDHLLFAKLFEAVQKVAKDKNLDTGGFRIVMNGGGAQAVDHLHIHVMGPYAKAAAL